MTLSTRKGVNVQRRILAPSVAGVQSEISDLRNSQPLSNFLRAVVVKVLNDTASMTEETLESLRSLVANPGFVDSAPRNAIIVRVVSGGADRRGAHPILCYPFLPSHISLPVKTGEQVWIMYENPDAGGSLPYWLWRISESRFVEDVNYTHADRKFDRLSSGKSTSDKISSTAPPVPNFPNGGGTEDSMSLIGDDDYESLLDEDQSYEDFTPEPVPRYTKRPSDTTIQGSNNALINLGEDRTVGPARKTEKKKSSGAIDIVTGRSRFLPSPGEIPKGTAPGVIKNTRENLETDKNPALSRNKENSAEGDPDIRNDASRVYVGQRTNGDEALGLTSATLPKKFSNEPMNPVDDQAFIFARSDNLRFIARKDQDHGINGSIIMMKEGDPDGDQGAFIIMPDGTVRIDGPTVFIGRPGGSGPGPGGSEPYIKFSEYKKQMSGMIDKITQLLDQFNIAFAVPVAAPGTPHPGLSSQGVTAIAAAKTQLSVIKNSIDGAKSTRIFGD